MNKELKDVVRVAKNNGAESKYLAGISFEKEEKYREAFRWFLESANDGHIEAQIKIGDYYANGVFIKQDFQKSVLWYTRASTYGNTEALIKLADLYREGLGTEKDMKLAFDLYYRASATSENADALYQLALMARHGQGTNKDDQSAFVWFKKASDLGHGKAMVNVGYCYANGVGVEKNPALAVEYYQKASFSNSPIALFNLGMCYKEGFGVAKDVSRAIDLFRRASEMDHSLSYTYLARCYQEIGSNEQLIIDCFENAYAQGSYKACYYLSQIYLAKEDYLSEIEWLLKGQNDVDCLRELGILCYEGEIAQLDYRKSFECFYKAAEQGDAISCYYTALLYFNGQGVEQDEERGLHYLELASNAKHKEAMFLLASKLEESDPNKALSLLEECVKLDSSEAYYKLGRWYSNGYIVRKDEKIAFNYYSRASELGNYNAMCNLAICYINGKGIKASADLGVYWFKKAAEGNVINAKFNLGYCYQNGVGTSKDLTSAINNYSAAASEGHIDSALKLGEIYVNEESVKDYQTAIYWLNIAMEKGNKKAYELLSKIYGSEAYYDEGKLNYIKQMIGE